MNRTILSPPRRGLTIADCQFYHVMDLPGFGVTQGQWDLRPGVNDYLGRLDFRKKRVLEIGPASGFVTFEMERRGADVIAVEVTDEPGWDFVPFPRDVLAPHMTSRRQHMHALKNSWWFARERYGASAEMCYGDAYNLPDEIGEFDIAIMGAVLTHCRSPVRIIEQCAKRARSIVIAEPYHVDLEGRPICRLNPSKENRDWGTWWHFSTEFFTRFLGVMGFEVQQPILHSQIYHGVPVPLFTVIGRRVG